MKRLLWTAGGLAVACAIAVVVAPLASSAPDGLETVAEGAGFADKFEAPPTVESPMPDYAVSGVGNDRLSTGLAGIVGALVAAAFIALVGWALTARRKPDDGDGPS